MSRVSASVSFVATVLAGLWLGQLLYLALPNSLTSWGVELEYSSALDQRLQVYHSDDKEWFVEEDSEIRYWEALPAGKTRSVFFNLPDASLTKLRIDPASVPGEFTIEDIRITGLGGIFQREIELRVDKGENVETADGKENAYVALNEDPWIVVSYKKEPIIPPSLWFKVVHWFVLILAALLIAWLRYRVPAVGDRWLTGWRSATALGVLGFYVAYYVWPLRLVSPGVFYLGLVPLLLGLVVFTLCDQPDQWQRYRSPAVLTLAGLLVYFLIHAALIGPDVEPGRLAVVSALLGVLALLVGFVVFWQKVPPLPVGWSSGLLRGYLAVTAVVALYWIADYYTPSWNLGRRMRQAGTFPLYRPISGSVCFALGLILLALLPPIRGKARLNLLFVIPFAVALTFWPLLCQSRGPMYAIGITLVVVFFLHRKLSSGAVVAVFFTLSALFAFTPAPLVVGKMLRSSSSSEELTDAARKPRLLQISDRSRSEIYRRYLAAIPEHLLVGHGFNAPDQLPMELKHRKAEHHGATRTPHNVHLSVLYFGGLIGGLLHFATLAITGFSLLWRVIKNRDALALVLLGLISFATACITFEATLIAATKEAVLLWRPNSYWLYYWIPLCAAVGYLASLRCASRAKLEEISR